MAITYRHTETGRIFTAREPTDVPVVRQRERARLIRQLDAAPQWERVEEQREESAGVQETGAGPSPDYDSMSLKDLRAAAKDRGLSAGGSKADIRERLAASEE